MSQQLSISSAFSVLALAFLCVVAAANSSSERAPIGDSFWVKVQAEHSLPG